jgi:hypothetical protein
MSRSLLTFEFASRSQEDQPETKELSHKKEKNTASTEKKIHQSIAHSTLSEWMMDMKDLPLSAWNALWNFGPKNLYSE